MRVGRMLPVLLALLFLLPAALSQPSGATSAPGSPEQQLIETYVPIMGLKNQTALCDEDGEPYLPLPVEAVLGEPDVTLKRKTPASASDQVVTTAPQAIDLYAKGSDYYLDLPGNPRRPGCTYERWSDSVNADLPATTYAHIVSDGRSRLVVQYWFYYVFNNFNNTHESDWEMMQVVFDVGTVEEALRTEPVAIGLAQHGGGESADWSDDKVQRDGTHPIVFAAAGSHATQYGNAVYLGWGEDGTGFGCDTTTGHTTLITLQPVLLSSHEADPEGEFSWLNFAGRWGERQAGEYNGPTGPATKSQWTSPVLWQEELRSSSIRIPVAETIGPAPTEVFCSISAWGSNIYRQVGDSTPLLLTVVGILLVSMAALIGMTWPTLLGAVRLYRRAWPTLIVIDALLIPIGIVFNGFQFLATRLPPGTIVMALLGNTPGAYYALALLLLIFQHLASLVVAGPMVIETFEDLNEGRSPALRDVWRRTRPHIPHLLRSIGRGGVIIVLLSVTLIGVPVAIWLTVRWFFILQATMLDGATGKQALERSAASVQGRWWRVALTTLAMLTLAAVPGVILGLGFLILGHSSVQFTNGFSSLMYLVTVPLSLLGTTLIYRGQDFRRPSSSTVAVMITTALPASEAAPGVDRAWVPIAGPNRSIMKSEKPLIT
jgi:hypothetical protein